MGKLDNRVALITGAARGQGRSHACTMAAEGADILAVDSVRPIETIPYAMPTELALEEAVDEIRKTGRHVHSEVVDVRDYSALRDAIDAGVDVLGRLDVVVINAGVLSVGRLDELSDESWNTVIQTNLTGAWHTAKAAIPHLKESNSGGSIVITGSTSSTKGVQNVGHYVTAKHGLVGLMRTLALELADFGIRVNMVNPTSVDTGMIHNDMIYDLFGADLPSDRRNRDDLRERFQELNALPVPWIDPVDVSNAVLWLASDEARYVTGAMIPVDAGLGLK